MPNEILNAICNFDWISPSWMILQDFANRPVSHFGIQANAGFDRGDIRRALRKHGVRSWGYVYNVDGDLIMISVPKAQAQWANYLLMREGVPVLYAPAEVVGEPAAGDRREAGTKWPACPRFLTRVEAKGANNAKEAEFLQRPK